MLLAEAIVAKATEVLTAAVTGDVVRGRVDPLEDIQLPAVGVFQGADEPLERQNIQVMDQLLEVRTEVATKADEGEVIETLLNELRRQVHLALMAENALGLPYVIDIVPDGADEPDIQGTAERITGTMVVRWIVHYRHRVADASEAP